MSVASVGEDAGKGVALVIVKGRDIGIDEILDGKPV
jgi:hypothetical protein